MSPGLHEFLSLDLPAMLTGTLAMVACGLLGNFLVLRRMSLLGDAVSHAVLPGLVAGFLLTGSRATMPMFLGAAGAGILTVVLIEAVRRLGRMEPGAAMAVVFSVLFALGVLLIEQAAARGIDLDADCVLNGQLEDVFWLPPATWSGMLHQAWSGGGTGGHGLPRELLTLAGTALAAAGFVAVFFKELRIVAFDPALATSLGIRASAMHVALMVLVAAAVVASFEAVGSILVIAALICPPATARLLTDRLGTQIWISLVLALMSGIGGYLLATYGPGLIGAENAVSAAGMITVVSGGLLAVAIVAAPEHGVLAKRIRHGRMAVSVAREDLLSTLYRLEETGASEGLARAEAERLIGGGRTARRALAQAGSRGEVKFDGTRITLTDRGREPALALVRAHRLWESYLVGELGLAADHVHPRAELLEHITDPAMAAKLKAERAAGKLDPHGRPIPE